MASYSPILGNPKPQYEDSLGVPYVGMRLFFYIAGTATKQDTKTTSAGSVTNTNPIVIGADGYPESAVMIYGDDSLEYKVVAAPPGTDDPPTSPLWTIDNISTDDALRADLASTTSATLGSYLVGVFLSATGYVGRTLSAWIASRPYYASDFVTDMTGATDMTAELQSAITAANGKELHIDGTILVTTNLTGVSNVVIKGVGRGATIKTATADIILWTFTGNSDVTIENIKFEMVVGTTQSSNHCLEFSGCSNVTVRDCEFSGMSGDGVKAHATSTYITVENCYFHDFTGSLQDSTDINFYNGCTDSTAINNRCFGGNWHGIKFQIDSTDNIAIGNHVGPHTAYGIICYETSPKQTRNIVTGNKIEGILGSALISGFATAGMGVYILGNGDVVVSNNLIKNCNINTTTETLTPGAIGVSGSEGAVSITGNVIVNTKWYGIAVFSNYEICTITGNTILECTKNAIYTKNSDYLTISSNTISQVTIATRAIYCASTSAIRDQISIIGNVIRGSSLAIETSMIDNVVISGNSITDCTDRGIVLSTVNGASVTGNVVHDSLNNCLRLNAAKYVVASNNHLRAGPSVTNYIDTAGVCTGSVINCPVVEPTASITAFADAGGGQVTVTSAAHGLSNSITVNISGTTNYNGNFTTSNVTTDTFEITDTWVADDATGTWKVRKILSNAGTGCQIRMRANGTASGTFATGDIIDNIAPAASTRSMGWVWVSGAWATWGDIS